MVRHPSSHRTYHAGSQQLIEAQRVSDCIEGLSDLKVSGCADIKRRWQRRRAELFAISTPENKLRYFPKGGFLVHRSCMMQVNLFRPVPVKTLTSQKRRALLTARKLLQEKAIAIENDIRGLLRNFGLKVGVVGTIKFGERIHDLLESMSDRAELIEPLLEARDKLCEEHGPLHRKVLALTRHDAVCSRLMTIPGVGPVVALCLHQHH
jgi:hypothetical protein